VKDLYNAVCLPYVFVFGAVSFVGVASLPLDPVQSLFGRLVADGWCWFVLREEQCWLVAGGWFVLRGAVLAGG
jgi:hypothetical protein